jgi:hypothetical protein
LALNLSMPFLHGLKRQAVIVAAVSLWIPTVAFGLWVLGLYSNTPGKAATPPPDLPVDWPAQPLPGRAALFIFIHPQCPCSRASIGELAVIMTRAREKPETYVLFYSPASKSNGWVKTDLWRSVMAIPGVRAIEDTDGVWAQHFGAATSGQALLYDRQRHLIFNGGLTASRGHSGDNYGRDAVTTLLQGGNPSHNMTPVFGCSLRGQ